MIRRYACQPPAGVSRLTQIQIQIATLHHIDGLNQSEIAKRLGITQPTVNYHLKRIIAKLKKALQLDRNRKRKVFRFKQIEKDSLY